MADIRPRSPRRPAPPDSDVFVIPPDSSEDDVFTVPDDEGPPAYAPAESTRVGPAPARRRTVAGFLSNLINPDQDDRVLGRVPDRRTPEELAAGRAAAGRRLLAGAAAADQTLVQTPEQAARANATTQGQLRTREAAAARRTPEALRELSSEAMRKAEAMRAAGLAEKDPAKRRELIVAAHDMRTKATNADIFAGAVGKADTFSGIATSNLLGLVDDPYSVERENIRAMETGGDEVFFTPEEQASLGVDPIAATRDFDIRKDFVAPAVGQLPTIVAGGMAGRTLARGAAAGLEKLGMQRGAKIAQALGTVMEEPRMQGPVQPTVRGMAADLAADMRAATPTLLKRGAVEGNLLGAATDARIEQQSGGDPAMVGALSLGIGAVAGAAGEVLLGGAGRAARGIYGLNRATRGAGRFLPEWGLSPEAHEANSIFSREARDATVVADVNAAATAQDPTVRASVAEADAARAAEGRGPVSDQTDEAQLRATLLRNLETLRGTREQGAVSDYTRLFDEANARPEAQPAGPEWWEQAVPPEVAPAGPEPRLVEPVEGFRARPTPEDNPPLRSAADVAAERAQQLSPSDEANAVVQMQRAQERALAEEAAMRAAAEAEANDPSVRLEQAAQQRPAEKQGPLTLAQTVARATRDADAGEPLAVGYRDAINGYVDALAKVQDAGDKVKTADRVALGRARQALQRAREQYGRQFGASAVLALAAGADELTQDEADSVGAGDVLAAAAVVPLVPKSIRRAGLRALEGIDDFEGRSIASWATHIAESAPYLSTDAVERALMNLHEGSSYATPLSAGDVRRALEGGQVDRAFYSRLERAVEKLPKKWDNPAPAADWIGKLKGGGDYSKQELGLILPALEEARTAKRKLSRAEVLDIITERSPSVERRVLMDPNSDPKAVAAAEPARAAADEIVPVDEVPFHRPALEAQAEARRARVRELEAEIRDRQTEAENDMDAAERHMQSEHNALVDVVEDWPNGTDAAREASAAVDEALSEGHGTNRAVEKGMEAFYENVEMPQAVEDLDVRYELEPDQVIGPAYVSAETTYRKADGGRGGVYHRIELREGETFEQAEERLRHQIEQTYLRQNIEHIEFSRIEEERGDRWVAYDGDDEPIASDSNEWDLRDKVARQFDALSQEEIDDKLGTFRQYLDDYARAREQFSEAESTHYYYTEDTESAFEEQYRETNELLGEVAELESDAEQAPDVELPEDADRTYYDLTRADQQYVDRLRDMGAIGTMGPIADGDTHARTAVFDPEIPHTPLPEPYRPRAAADPDQLDIFGPDVPEGANTDNLMPVARKVYGPPTYRGMQVFGGSETGDEYTELLAVWENNPGKAYTLNHYGYSHPNLIGHVRARVYNVPAFPDIEDWKVLRETFPGIENVPAAQELRGKIIETSRGIDRLLERQRELVEEQGRLTQATRVEDIENAVRPRLEEMAREYRVIEQEVQDKEQRVARLTEELRGEVRALNPKAADAPRERIRVLVENQSDWAQDAGRLGVKTTPDPEDLKAKQDAYQAAVDAHSVAYDANYDLLSALRSEADAMGVGRFGAVDPESYHFNPDIFAELRRNNPTFPARMDELLRGRREVALLEEQVSAARDALEKAQGNTRGVPPNPFITGGTKKGVNSEGEVRWDSDGAMAYRLSTANFLLDAAERMYTSIGWSTAENRVVKAHLKVKAARLTYDEGVTGAIRSLLGGLGFKDLKIERRAIGGASHWYMKLTPDMVRAIRKNGFPVLGVLAAAALPSDAEAQGRDRQAKGDKLRLYGSLLGATAAGYAIAAAMKNRQVRRLLKMNARLAEELSIDDLSGLANRRAFNRARSSIDADAGFRWLALDADRFKAMNDTHGHPAGDKAIQHFGRTLAAIAEEHSVPPRIFRTGGDEFAFAVPAERAAEVLAAVEARSKYTTGDVTTGLTGGEGATWEEADAAVTAIKKARKAADPSLRRTPPTGNATVYANPIGAAVQELRRGGSAAAVGVAGAILAANSEDEKLERTGVGLMALGALSAVGSQRLIRLRENIGGALVDALRQTGEGRSVVRFFNPEALLDPEVREAIGRFEAGRARASARASEFAGKAQALGPAGDRAVSDVIEGEGWEPTETMTPEDLQAVFDVAAQVKAEYDDISAGLVTEGAAEPSDLLPNYAGPRRYAYHEADAVLGERTPRVGGGSSRKPRIAPLRSRQLDIPVYEARAALREAQASGDAAKIAAAEEALDRATAESYGARTERGEIREQSYRAAEGIERGHADVAAAQLFNTLKTVPGAVHPEQLRLLDEIEAAKDLLRQNPGDADLLQELRNLEADHAKLTRGMDREDSEYVRLPDTRTYGRLRGLLVKRDIAHSIRGFDQTTSWQRLLQFWKEAKTIFNPGTHAANFVSNVGFMHMEGVPVWRQPAVLKRAAKDMRAYGPATRALAEAGVLDANAVSERPGMDARSRRSHEGMEELLGTTRPETAKVLRESGMDEAYFRNRRSRAGLKGALGGAVLGGMALADAEDPELAAAGGAIGAAAGMALGRTRSRAALRKLYANGDNIFRVGIYLDRIERGMTPEAALRDATEALGNFRTRSPALHFLRNTVSPFALYPAKALPRFAKQIVDHPWRYVMLASTWALLDQYAQHEVGEVPESDLSPRDRQSALGYLLPGFTQLPFSSPRGERAATDMSRWTPLSGLTTAAPPGAAGSAFSDEYPGLLQPSGPIFDIGARLGANADPFTGREHFRKDYPLRENIATALNDVAETALPPALSFHQRRVKEDIKNRDWEKTKTDLLGPTGLRPRFVRPGGNTRAAIFQLESSLRAMKYDMQREIIANKNPKRAAEIAARFQRRVQQAAANFRERVGADPPDDLMQEILSPEP